MVKTIILEPSKCEDKCKNVRLVFEEQVKEGKVSILSMDSEEGKKIAAAFGIIDLTEPKIIVVTDVPVKQG
jgi:hypothetical protein